MNKILIISLKHLGDLVTTTCMVPLINEIWPQAEIHYLANPAAVPLVAHNPLVAKIHIADRHGGLKSSWRLFRDLRREKFDLVLDYSEGDRGAFWALATLAKERIGYRCHKPHYFRNFVQTRLMPDRAAALDRNISVCHAEALTLLGHQPTHIPLPQVFFSSHGQDSAKAFLQKHHLAEGKRFSLFHMTSREIIRQWPRAHCLEAINWTLTHVGPIVLTAWSDPREMEFVDDLIKSADGPVINAAGVLDLDGLMALTNEASLVVAVDSMVGHLGGALGRPTVSIFGPYADVHWAPRGELVRVAHVDDRACRPCVRIGNTPGGGCRPGGVSGCLEDLDFDTYVRPLIQEVLKLS